MQVMEDGKVHVAHHNCHRDDPEHHVDILNAVGIDFGGQAKERYSGYETESTTAAGEGGREEEKGL